MRVLVTGGAGFIGSHVVRAHVERGDEVTVADTLTTGKRERVPLGVEFHLLDVRSPLFARLLALKRFDLINHQAGQVSVSASVARPSEDADVNVLGTLRVLEAAANAGVPKVVLASSCAVYGDPLHLPLTESTPAAPLSPYGVAKRCMELYAATLSHLRGLHVTCLRYANVYGPGAEPHTEAGVVPLFVAALRAGRAPRIYGDGAATRDYIEVADIAAGNVAASALTGCHIVNLGTGIETSVNELAGLLRERLGGPPAEHVAARPGDIMRSLLDVSLAQTVMGWQAKTRLAEGLDRLLASPGIGTRG